MSRGVRARKRRTEPDITPQLVRMAVNEAVIIDGLTHQEIAYRLDMPHKQLVNWIDERYNPMYQMQMTKRIERALVL